MTEKPMTVAEVANFLRRSIKSVKRLPIPFSRVGKGRVTGSLMCSKVIDISPRAILAALANAFDVTRPLIDWC